MAEKPNPTYKLLKTEVPINFTSEPKKTFDSVNKDLIEACELPLKQPNPRKQLVLVLNGSSRSAGCALMIEDNPDQKIQSKWRKYAPMAFGWKIFLLRKIQDVQILKRILGNLHGFAWVCTPSSVGSNKANNCSDLWVMITWSSFKMPLT